MDGEITRGMAKEREREAGRTRSKETVSEMGTEPYITVARHVCRQVGDKTCSETGRHTVRDTYKLIAIDVEIWVYRPVGQKSFSETNRYVE